MTTRSARARTCSPDEEFLFTGGDDDHNKGGDGDDGKYEQCQQGVRGLGHVHLMKNE